MTRTTICFILLTTISPTACLYCQEQDVSRQIGAVIQQLNSQSYFAAAVLISSLEKDARAKAGTELTPARLKAALQTPGNQTILIALLQQASASFQDGNWENELYSLYAAGLGVAKLDAQVTPLDRFRRDSAIAEHEGTPAWFHRAARAALDAGLAAESLQYVKREIALIPGAYPKQAEGLIMHKAYTLMGLASLTGNDPEGAATALMASLGEATPAAFGAVGPSMALVKQFLIRNQTGPALLYLSKCEEIGWPSGQQKLEMWKAAIQAGQTPNFGAAATLY